jgi:hypothetical protein
MESPMNFVGLEWSKTFPPLQGSGWPQESAWGTKKIEFQGLEKREV